MVMLLLMHVVLIRSTKMAVYNYVRLKSSLLQSKNSVRLLEMWAKGGLKSIEYVGGG